MHKQIALRLWYMEAQMDTSLTWNKLVFHPCHPYCIHLNGNHLKARIHSHFLFGLHLSLLLIGSRISCRCISRKVHLHLSCSQPIDRLKDPLPPPNPLGPKKQVFLTSCKHPSFPRGGCKTRNKSRKFSKSYRTRNNLATSILRAFRVSNLAFLSHTVLKS